MRNEHRKRLSSYLADHPCIECGETDIRVLDFDHRDEGEKRCNVARMLGGGISWDSIAREIAKCDVRCANCHRKRTCERGQWWRQAVHDRTTVTLRAEGVGRLRSIFSASL